MKIAESANAWKKRYTPIKEWDRMFSEGRWDYLDSIGEAARYALIAGYIHRRPSVNDVLDVGCGAGILIRYLDRSRIRYRGIDLSQAAIDQARERFPHDRFDAIDLASYEPASGELFDAIVFNEVLPHIDDPLGSFSRYCNYLRPHGIVIISTFQNPNPSSNAAMFTALLDEAVAAGDLIVLTRSEVTTSEKGLKWRVDVLAGDHEPRADG